MSRLALSAPAKAIAAAQDELAQASAALEQLHDVPEAYSMVMEEVQRTQALHVVCSCVCHVFLRLLFRLQSALPSLFV